MEQRILLLADSASPHTEKWALALASKGFKVGLFSLNKASSEWYSHHPNIVLLHEPKGHQDHNRIANKLSYLLVLPRLLRCIRRFKPSLLHAHYASSYGLLGALSSFRPFVVSAWGSDVFEFPRSSLFHKYLLKFNLHKADQLLATSHALRHELWNYARQDVQVIPFGVNTDAFHPQHVTKPEGERDTIYIGTIKSIEDKYGIQTILEALLLVKNRLPSVPLKLFLVGGGSQLERYKAIALEMGLSKNVVFTGKIPFKKIPYYHNLLDIFLNVSIVDESFGVSVIEAMACEKPVIVTSAPGLKEIVNHSSLGIIVEKENAEQLAGAIIRLALSPELRVSMGTAGRKHVLTHYDFEHSLEQMSALYARFLRDKQAGGLPQPAKQGAHSTEPVA